MENFITAPYRLSEHCQFGGLRDELIRDRIGVGILDQRLSEKSQLDQDLTLEKAVTLARQSETVKQQQKSLRSNFQEEPESQKEIDLLKAKQAIPNTAPPKSAEPRPPRVQGKATETCGRCGYSPAHNRARCPARDSKCHNCQKIGHYSSVCRSKAVGRIYTEDQEGDRKDSLFLATLTTGDSKAWMVTLAVEGRPVTFKIDTGADVFVMSLETFTAHCRTTLLSPEKTLKGPDRQPLRVVGQFRCRLGTGQNEVKETLFVVENLTQPLLGRPAIENLALVSRINSVATEENTFVSEYPEVFSG